MDPTTILPPPPQLPPPPPPPPENPHTPPDTITGEPSTSRNIENLKSLVLNLAGQLLPAHQSLIKQRFDDILPDELPIPDHPPYSDMILTAMWELNRDGASSEEAISDFIKKEYRQLPWAHSTILSHHLRDLQIKDKITMTDDKCYVRCPLISKPIVRPSIPIRCPSPMSSSYSSSSASLCSSPSSSSTSSSFCWDSSHETYKRKKKRKRRRRNMKGRGGTMIHVRGRGRGRGRGSGSGSGSGRGRGRPPLMNSQNRVGQRGRPRETIRGRKRGRLCNEFKIAEESRMEEEQMDVDDVEEPIRETEDPNEVGNMEVEEDAIRTDEHRQKDEAEKQENQPQKKNDIVESGILVEDQTEESVHKKEESVHEKEDSVVLRRSRRKKIVVSDEENVSQKQYKVTWIGRGVRRLKESRRDLLEDDESEEEDVEMIDSDAEVDEYVEQLEEKDVKGATIVECNQPEDNGHSDIVEEQILGENDDTEKQIKRNNKEKTKTCEQEKSVGNENMPETETVVKTEAEVQNDYLTEQSKELHDDDVTEQLIHPQEQCVEKTKDSHQSNEQSQLKNGDPESTEEQPQQEEQQTEEKRKEIVPALARIQQTKISEKDTLQDKNNDNSASSCSMSSADLKHQDEQKRPLRQRLRSSYKKQETTSKSKKQVETVTPVRRSLRSRETISEAAVITEVTDHSKEQIKPAGRISSSRREPKIAEAEQVSTSRKTRSSGLYIM